MKLVGSAAFSFLLAAASCPGAAAPGADRHPVDELSQAAIQSAFQILRTEYIRRDDLTFDELNRSALEGLLIRLSFGAELVKQNGPQPGPESGVHSELITPDIAYARPQTYAEAEISLLQRALGEFAAGKVRALILDLRSPALPGDFASASAILDFFVPQGELLFKLKQIGQGEPELMISRTDVLWKAPVVLLVDGETNHVGETIAAVLQSRRAAVLVGSPTRGAAVRYETVPVEDGWSLRYARAEMVLPDGGTIFKKGLQPHFRVDLPASVKLAIFKNSAGASIKPHVFDEARLRYNEAALVARKNPELDAFIRRSNGEKIATDRAPMRDRVLQRAVDMLEASNFLEKAAIKWNSGPQAAVQTPKPSPTPQPVGAP